ncbi:hypothetical protein AWM75_01350 [Aerococcus urinaehominis]|uniref:Uncharacterized protein n=1 Tax=Aerococcus urinaehominis TaxID=128944 RepID=A0A120IAP6_9LACT|nr:ABC transporter permease [Aerococcus urinaehominis]AMB98723.1 hypothetical protein AWM75_01350 [Aerococcus urinaehominis]SDM00158.1 hypothetical protein SAMN04487985_103130 [Aerococcus urinaehominis]
MKNLEPKKIKGTGIQLLLAIMIAMHLLFVLIPFSDKSYATTDYPLYDLLDTYFMMAMIFNPIFLAGMVKKVIEIEEQHHMWALLLSFGQSVQRILLNKWKTLAYKLLLVHVCEWGVMLVLASSSTHFEINPDLLMRCGIYFLTSLFINLFFVAFFILIEMKVKKEYFSTFFSIICSMSGIICMLTSKTLSYINPFAWYVTLLNISFVKEGDTFKRLLNDLQIMTFFISLLSLLLLIQVIKNFKNSPSQKEY